MAPYFIVFTVLIETSINSAISLLSYPERTRRMMRDVVVNPGVSGLEFNPGKGYKAMPLFVTDSLVWNEMQTTDFVDDTVRLNLALGEVQQRYATILTLTREVNGRTQKVMVFGDADCISNGELSSGHKGIRASNFTLIPGSFFWLSDDEVPIDVRRPTPPDDLVNLSEGEASAWTDHLAVGHPGIDDCLGSRDLVA